MESTCQYLQSIMLHAQNYTSDYKPGEQVHVQLAPKSKWKLGNIIKRDENPRSYHVKVDGATYRRNQRFIKREGRREYRNGSNSRNYMTANGYQRQDDKERREYRNESFSRNHMRTSGYPSNHSQDNLRDSDVNPRSTQVMRMKTRQSSGRCIKAPNRLDL